MVLEIIIIKFCCILKIMSRNTFPEPQPDSASSMGGSQICGFFEAVTFTQRDWCATNEATLSSS